nr:hypothetical protein [Desulfuromonadales bacterium]
MLDRAGPTGTIFMESVSPLVQPSHICIMSPSDITFKVLNSLFERGGHKAERIRGRESAIKKITGPDRIDMLIIDGDLPDEEGFVTLESVTA